MKNLTLLVTLFCLSLLTTTLTSAQNACLCPVNFKPKNVNSTSAVIYWSNSASNQTLRYRLIGAQIWTDIANAVSPYHLTGLIPSKDYEFDIIAADACGCTATLLPYWHFKTTEACREASNISATSLTFNSAVLSWSIGDGIAVQYLAYKESSESEFSFVMAPGTTDKLPVSSPYTLRGLKLNTAYDFRIQTFCRESPTTPLNSKVAHFTTPLKPDYSDESFHIINFPNNKLQANWFNSGENITSIELCYKIVGSSNETCIMLRNDASAFEIIGLPATSYTFRLKITRSRGVSNPASEVTTSTDALAKCDITASISRINQTSVVIDLFGNLNELDYVTVFYRKGNSAFVSRLFSHPSSIVLDGLDPSSEYSFYIQSSCGNGVVQKNGIVSNGSAGSFTTLSAPCPNATNFRITNVGATYIRNSGKGLGNFNVHDVTFAWDYTASSTTNFTVDLLATSSNDPIHTITTFEIPNNSSAYNTQIFFRLAQNVVYTITIRVRCANGAVNDRVFSLINPDPGSIDNTLVGSNNDNKIFKAQNQKTKYLDNQNIINSDIITEVAQSSITPTASFKKTKGIVLSPNPTNGVLNIAFSNDDFEQVHITTIEGRIVKQIALEINSRMQKIDCSDLPNGLYFISAKGLGKVTNTKFIKN